MMFYFKQIAGLIQWSNQRALFDWLLSHNDYKGEYIVTIEKYKAKRSLGFNAYLWGVVYKLISNHTGHTPQELHEIYIRMFIPPKFINYRDKEIEVPSGTSGMDTTTFWNYVDRVIAEGASMGVEIPPPNSRKEEFDIQAVYSSLEVPEGEVKF